ncbi:MAG: peptidoglycan D,D-transpeptidase FtsI family protein [Acidimicrobiia bacterium]
MRRAGWRVADLRLVLVAVLLILAFGGIGYRLLNVQGLHPDAYVERGIDQRVRHEALPAKRGTIFDRDGVELAVSISAVTLVADPSQIDDPIGVARMMAPLLDLDEPDLVERLSKEDSRFAYVARRLEREAMGDVGELVESLGLAGFTFVDEPRRVYPAGALASQILGFVQDDDGVGLEGLEYEFDSVLAGTPGALIVERDPYGNPIPQGELLIEPAVPGGDLLLTIDREIEFMAQQALERTLAETGAIAGTVVVLDVGTGEILALVNAPSFDPNDRSGAEAAQFRNRAVTDVYEPGSTLKVVTVSAALEEGVVTPSDRIVVPEKLVIHDKKYTDTGRQGDAEMSVAEIVARSSNIGTILIQQSLGNDAHFRYLSAFGLGAAATTQFPGEVDGSLQPVGEWCRTTCGPSTAIGYRVDVTPLQMAAVFATIANDGVWVQPHVVKEVIPGEGEPELFEPARRPVLSAETARTMLRLLQGVVEEGTGTRAQIAGYTVGGKTGTTEKFVPGEGYSMEDRIASFIGMAPLTDPEIVVAVVLDSPHGEIEDGVDMKFGGVSAAPLFAEVTEATLHLLGVEPDAV